MGKAQRAGQHPRDWLKEAPMEEALHIFAEYISLIVNLFAMVAIAIGAIEAAIRLIPLLVLQAPAERLRPVWLNFGRWLIAGLTFQLAADIVETTVAPTWPDIGKLAAIAGIRTFLNYFLDKDVNELRERGAEERRRAAEVAATAAARP
jgi:uncharacterized membrane protein